MRRFHSMLSLSLLATLAAAPSALAQETFDAAPVGDPTWNPTVYTMRWAQGGQFLRHTLAGYACAPAGTTYPISSTVLDMEGVYTNPGAMTREAHALMPNVVLDSYTQSFVQLCPFGGTADRTTVAVTARVGLSPVTGNPVRAYMATLSVQPGSANVWLRVIKDLNGDLDADNNNIIDAADSLGPAPGYTLAGAVGSQYLLSLNIVTNPATGAATITASSRVVSIDPVTGLMVLGAAISRAAVDAAPLAAGYCGLAAFAPLNNTVYWDDVTGTCAGGGNPNPNGFGAAPKRGDLNADGLVDDEDLAAIVEAYAQDDADLNADGLTDAQDLVEFLDALIQKS